MLGWPRLVRDMEASLDKLARNRLKHNCMKGKKLGIVVERLGEGSKRQTTDASRQFIAADNTEALVTVDDVAHRVAREIVLSKFDMTTCASAYVVERDDTLTLRSKQHGAHQPFVDTAQTCGDLWRPLFGQEDQVGSLSGVAARY